MSCRTCSGSGRCPYCGGSGSFRCLHCNGAGTVSATCSTCGGSGRIDDAPCAACNGSGRITVICEPCNGVGNLECALCRGTGDCKDCGGTGDGATTRNSPPDVTHPELELGQALRSHVSLLDDGSSLIDRTRYEVPGEAGDAVRYLQAPNVIDIEGAVRDRAPRYAQRTHALQDPFVIFKEWQGGNSFKDLEIGVVDIEYGRAVHSVAEPQALDVLTIDNDTAVAQEQTLQNRIIKRQTVRWSVTKAVKTGTSATGRFNIPVIGIGVDVQGSTDVTLSEVREATAEVSQEWQWSFRVPIPARTKIKMTVMLSRTATDIPFSGTVQIRGKVTSFWGKMINGMLLNNPPAITPIGKIFTDYPFPFLQVIDEETVRVKAEGLFKGIYGVSVNVVTTDRPDG